MTMSFLPPKLWRGSRIAGVGEVISDLVRRSLRPPQAGGERNGIPLLSSRPGGPMVDLETVNALRD